MLQIFVLSNTKLKLQSRSEAYLTVKCVASNISSFLVSRKESRLISKCTLCEWFQKTNWQHKNKNFMEEIVSQLNKFSLSKPAINNYHCGADQRKVTFLMCLPIHSIFYKCDKLDHIFIMLRNHFLDRSSLDASAKKCFEIINGFCKIDAFTDTY